MKKLAAAKQRHRRRHSPTGATFALADRIDYLNGEHWDSLTRGTSIFQQRAFARALEAAAPENVKPRVLICGNVMSTGPHGVAPESAWPAVSEALLLRHRIAPLKPVLSRILEAIPHDEAPERHPFASSP